MSNTRGGVVPYTVGICDTCAGSPITENPTVSSRPNSRVVTPQRAAVAAHERLLRCRDRLVREVEPVSDTGCADQRPQLSDQAPVLVVEHLVPASPFVHGRTLRVE